VVGFGGRGPWVFAARGRARVLLGGGGAVLGDSARWFGSWPRVVGA